MAPKQQKNQPKLVSMHLNLPSLQLMPVRRAATEPTTSESTSHVEEPAAPERLAEEQGPTEAAADQPDLEASVIIYSM